MILARNRRTAIVSLAVFIGMLLAGGAIFAQRSVRLAFTHAAAKSLGVYTLGEEFRNHLDLVLKLQMSRAPEQEMQLTGTLVRTPVDLQGGAVEIAYRIDAPHVTFKGASAPDAELRRAERELAADLSRRFYVRHRPDGAALAVHFERGYSPANANILLTIVGSAQLVGSTPEQSTWTAVEKDANGEYMAAYARTAPGRVTKRKLRYLSAAKPQRATNSGLSRALAPRIDIEQARYDMVTSGRGRVSELTGVERVAMTFGALGMSMSTEVKITLSGFTAREHPELIGEFERDRPNYLLQPIEVMSEDPRVRRGYEDRAVLKGATLDDLWAEMLALTEPNDSSRNSAVVRRLEALFRLQETSIEDAIERLPRTSEPHGKLVLDALSLARTEAAQAGLAAVAGGARFVAMQREYAIRYLSPQDSPSEASRATLSRLIDDADPRRRQFARFAYGTLASRIAEHNPERAREVVQSLMDRVPAAVNDSERSDLYLALGNSASSLAFPLLRAAATGGSGILRVTAIESLGRIDDPGVVPLFSELLRSTEERVRMATLSGIQRREVGPFLPALVELARHDPSADVRSAAIEMLGAQLRATPQLREVLLECASKDTENKVRQVADRQLRNLAQSG